jgi:predicted phage-related endonuclease
MTQPPSTTDNGSPVATPIDDLSTWVDAYRAACANRDQWAEIADRAKQQITQQLERNAAEVGTINNRPAVRWTNVTSHRLDTKTLKAKDPELAEKYTVTTSSRRFTVITDSEAGAA